MLICMSFACSRKMGQVSRGLPICTRPSSFYLIPGSPGSLFAFFIKQLLATPALPLTHRLSFILSWYPLGSVLLSFFYAFTYFSQLFRQALYPLLQCSSRGSEGEEKYFCRLPVAIISMTPLVFSDISGNA